jgi:hypothetical protein
LHTRGCMQRSTIIGFRLAAESNHGPLRMTAENGGGDGLPGVDRPHVAG